MTVLDRFATGDLQQTLTELQQHIRRQPAETKHRIFLFQLYCVLGEWQKALNQLNVLRDLDASTLPMAQTYQEAIQCEALRAQVFAGQRAPLLFGEPEQWLAWLIEALRLTAQGQHDQASALREQALEQAPATSGQLNDTAFEWLADADPRFGPVLEAIVNGRYYWIPLNNIRQLQIEAPTDLRDLVWLPAQFTWANGGETVGLIPVRYPGSESSSDDAIRLARKTDWHTVNETTQLGLGQRLFATENADHALLDTRTLTFTTDATALESIVTSDNNG
jgi:type VI secretion system protein ImpE